MASITSSNFGAPLQSLQLSSNTRITPAVRIPASVARRTGPPNPGLGACWGWTPSGEVSINCGSFMDSVNKNDTEFLIDCAAFTTPSDGYVRLYLEPEAPGQLFNMPLILVPDVAPSKSDQTYPLSQVFEPGQTVDVYPGAKLFNAPIGTFWDVNQNPAPYTWSPSGQPTLKLTPATTSITYILGPRLVQATWTIAI